MTGCIPEPPDWTVTLSDDERDLVAACINIDGKGQHPVAEPCGLKFFVPKYAIQCIKKAMDDEWLTPEGVKVAKTVLGKLK